MQHSAAGCEVLLCCLDKAEIWVMYSAQIVEQFYQIFHRTASLPSIGLKTMHLAEMTKRDAAVEEFTRLCQELREHGHAWAFIWNIGSHLPLAGVGAIFNGALVSLLITAGPTVAA